MKTKNNLVLIKIKSRVLKFIHFFKWLYASTRGRIIGGSIIIIAAIVQISGMSVKDLLKRDTSHGLVDEKKNLSDPTTDSAKQRFQPVINIAETKGSNSPAVNSTGTVTISYGDENNKELKTDSTKKNEHITDSTKSKK